MRVAPICVSTIVFLKVFQNINELCRQILYCFQSKVVRDAVIGSRDPAGNGRDRVAVPTEGDRDADGMSFVRQEVLYLDPEDHPFLPHNGSYIRIQLKI